MTKLAKVLTFFTQVEDTCVKKNTLVKVDEGIQLLYSGKSKKVQVSNDPQRIKVKRIPLRDYQPFLCKFN